MIAEASGVVGKELSWRNGTDNSVDVFLSHGIGGSELLSILVRLSGHDGFASEEIRLDGGKVRAGR